MKGTPEYEDSFTLCFARVDRASEIREAMAEEWNAHLESKPREFRLVPAATGQWDMQIHALTPTPEKLSMLFGEWLYQLRAGLDGLAYQLAVRDSGEDPPPNPSGIYFPIFDSKTKFTKNRPRIGAMNHETVADLERIQPYHAEPSHLSNVLWWINELARLDRHRRGHAVRAHIRKFRIGVHPPAQCQIVLSGKSSVEIDEGNGTVIARVSAPANLTAPEVQELLVPDVENVPDIPEWLNRATAPIDNSLLDFRMKYAEIWVMDAITHFQKQTEERLSRQS